MTEWVYLNGSYVPYEHASIPVEDRGFLFADGVYEVIKCYGGRPFRIHEHLERLEGSARAIRLPLPIPRERWISAVEELLERNELSAADATVYIEVTRGPAPRNHAFPATIRPTSLILARPAPQPDPILLRDGAAAILVPDRRWHLCNVKTVGLLPNVLAKQEAIEAGAWDAIFVREGGRVTEASSANLFAVRGGTLYTHPEGPEILSGVTRRAILERAVHEGLPVREEPLHQDELLAADEVFLSGTTTEVLPITRIDGRPIGEGRPGPVTQRLIRSFQELVRGGRP